MSRGVEQRVQGFVIVVVGCDVESKEGGMIAGK
jgi:hypothetical protein